MFQKEKEIPTIYKKDHLSRKFAPTTTADPPATLLSKYFSNVAASIILSRIKKNSADEKDRNKYLILNKCFS